MLLKSGTAFQLTKLSKSGGEVVTKWDSFLLKIGAKVVTKWDRCPHSKSPQSEISANDVME